MAYLIDIGDDHSISWVAWKPDRELNPQFSEYPDEKHYGLRVKHLTSDGEPCEGFITFNSETTRRMSPNIPKWELVSVEPLTVTPSLSCRICKDHGFITEGRWVAV